MPGLFVVVLVIFVVGGVVVAGSGSDAIVENTATVILNALDFDIMEVLVEYY